MSALHVIAIQPLGETLSAEDLCAKALAKGRIGLNWPPLPVTAAPPPDTPPFPVLVLLNPKSWDAQNPKTVVVEIPAEPSAMHLTLRKNAVAAYVLGSWFQVNQLAVGVFGLAAFGRLLKSQGFDEQDVLSGDGLVKVLQANVSEDRRVLFEDFVRVRDELSTRRTLLIELIQSHSACRAINFELPACDRATLSEGRRYLSLASSDDVDIRAALSAQGAVSSQSLTGPEGRALVGVLRTLKPLYQRLQGAKAEWEAQQPRATFARDAAWASLLGPLAPVVMARDAVRLLREEPRDPPKFKGAFENLTNASQAFQAAFAAQAVRYPILFKIGDSLRGDEELWTRSAVEALADALVASKELAAKIRDDPSLAWRFPGLVDRTLSRGFSTESAMASRVAADELLRRNETPPFARLNAGLQIMTAPAFLVPFPAIELAVGIAALLGDAAELLESWFHTEEQRLGFRASLDPGLSLGPDASFVGTMVQAVSVALDILPIPGAVKQWAKEGAAAKSAVSARKIAAGKP